MSTATAETRDLRSFAALAALAVLCWVVLFHDLGGPALVEPDEGRNAEVAREILLLGDWVTPHYDFIPYLDKPIFFFWLAAGAYKLFGISEFAARLPAALAGLGCVLLVYDLARRRAGRWAALWSALVLATCPIFMAFSRAVIFDMPLAFFITLALWAFARGKAADAAADKFYYVMYAAAAAAVLTKGPIGVAIPILIIGAYLLARRRPALRALKPLEGAALLLLIAAPWYLWAEARNPGYLRYFFIEENFLRYLTPQFHRGQPWYFYFEVFALGFLPWTILFPLMFTQAAPPRDGDRLLLVLWAAAPFIFFSFSAAKQPGYVLPAFPPLALLVGSAVANTIESAPPRKRRLLAAPWIVLLLAAGIFELLVLAPSLFPPGAAAGVAPLLTAHSRLMVPALLVFLTAAAGASVWASPVKYFVISCGAFCALHLFAVGIFDRISENRSSKGLAQKTLPLIQPGDQVVVYNDYLSSLPFYLRAEKPLWTIIGEGGDVIMGSHYIAEKKPTPSRGSGEAVLSFDKFAEVWDHAPARLMVFVEEKKLPKLAANVGREPRRLSTVGAMVLVTNR